MAFTTPEKINNEPTKFCKMLTIQELGFCFKFFKNVITTPAKKVNPNIFNSSIIVVI
jgi:hypothetical protein